MSYWSCPYNQGVKGAVAADLVAPYKRAPEFDANGSHPLVIPKERWEELKPSYWWNSYGQATPMSELRYRGFTRPTPRTYSDSKVAQTALHSAGRCECPGGPGSVAFQHCMGGFGGSTLPQEYNSCDKLCAARQASAYYEREWGHGPCPDGKDIGSVKECRDALESLGFWVGKKKDKNGWYMDHDSLGQGAWVKDTMGLRYLRHGHGTFVGCTRWYTTDAWTWEPLDKWVGKNANPKTPLSHQKCTWEIAGAKDPNCPKFNSECSWCKGNASGKDVFQDYRNDIDINGKGRCGAACAEVPICKK